MTKNDLIELVSKYGKRGFIEERFGYFDISVPVWRVRKTTDVLTFFMPVGVKARVAPLTIFEHLFCWDVIFIPLDRFAGRRD